MYDEIDKISEIDFDVSSPNVSEFSLEVGIPTAGTVTYNFGEGLSYDKESNTLYVDVSDEVLEEDGLPISSIAILKLLSSYVKAEEGKVLSDNNFTDELLEKLKSLNNYTHPSKHPASMIDGLSKVATTGKYYDLKGIPTSFPASAHEHLMSEIEGLILALSQRAYKDHGHVLASHDREGFLSPDDKKKIDTMEEGANNYQHPEKHDVSIIDGLAKVARTNRYYDLEGIPEEFTPSEHTHSDKADLYEGKVPQEQLPEDIVYKEEGKLPSDVIPDDYVSVGEDGKISKDVIPDIIPTKLSDLSDDPEHRVVSDEEKERWDAKSDFDGSYESLKDVPDTFNPTPHEHKQYVRQEDVDEALLQKADSDIVYTKEETDIKLSDKVDKGTVYNKEEIDSKLSTKVDKKDVYTKEETDSKISGVYHFKGTKNTYADLPTEGNKIGDVWNILEDDKDHNILAGDNVAWDGQEWDTLAGMVNLSDYATKDDLNDKADLIEGKIPTEQIPDSVVMKEEGKGLSTNDYTDEERQRLSDAEKSLDALQREFEGHTSYFDAENVYFSEDLQTTYEIGSVSLEENGRATIPAKDKNLKQVWDSIFVKESYPTVVYPSLKMEATEGSYEVGTEIIPAYDITFDVGSYSYGPETNVLPISGEVADSRGEKCYTYLGNFPSLLIEDDTEYTITAIANYSEGAIPLTNLGNEYPEGMISAGFTDQISSPIKGYRNSFYGTVSQKKGITSDIIRSLSPSNRALKNGSAFDIPIPIGAVRVIVAYPAKLRDITSIQDNNGMGAEISGSFFKQTVEVAGWDGYHPIEYKVYSLDFANPNDQENTFSVLI